MKAAEPHPGEELESLDDVTSGYYVVTTEHGTSHWIDMDAHVIIRRGAPGREWDGSDRGFGGPVTADGRPMFFSYLADATVGRRMRVESGREWRITSTVVSIVVVSPSEERRKEAPDDE